MTNNRDILSFMPTHSFFFCSGWGLTQQTMIDQYTYDLLKRLHEFPCERDKNELEYGRFEFKYRAIYGDIKQIGRLLSQLKSLGYMDIPKNSTGAKIIFTQKGFDAVTEYENALVQNSRKAQIEDENLKLQNEQFRYQNKIRDKEDEIRDLTLKNLSLQNKQLRNKIIYAILGGAIMFILSNWKDILIIFRIIDKP